MRPLALHVVDRFDVICPDSEQSILPSGRKEIAILAMLACTNGMTLSRKFLCETLWSDRDVEQSRTSLRQALKRIRQRDPKLRDILNTTKVHVSLNPAKIALLPDPFSDRQTPEVTADQLLAGIDVPDRAFNEWLYKLRKSQLQVEAQLVNSNQPFIDSYEVMEDDAAPFSRAISITLYNAGMPGCSESTQVGDWLLDNIACWIDSLEFIDVYDQRTTNQPCPTSISVAQPAFRISVAVYAFERYRQCVIKMTDAITGRIAWNSTRTCELGASTNSQTYALVIELVDHLFLMSERLDTLDTQQNVPSIIGIRALGALLNPGLVPVMDVERWLNWGLEQEPSGLQFALSGLLDALRLGERLEPAESLIREKIRHQLTMAVKLSPSNATVRAIVGHVEGFVLGNSQEALNATLYATKLQPYNPLCLTFHSLALHYTNQNKQALKVASQAFNNGQNSIASGLINSVIGSLYTVSGDFSKARIHAEAARHSNPNFRPVLNTLLISYLNTAEPQRADQILQLLRDRDDNFTYQAVQSCDYPVKNSLYRKRLCVAIRELSCS